MKMHVASIIKNLIYFLNPQNNITYKLDLKNQFLHEFFNNNLVWRGSTALRKGSHKKDCVK